MSAREWTGWIVGTLIVAVVVHIASVSHLPTAVMHMALHRMGSVNTIHHQPRVTAKSRSVVRPSPDLLYSSCVYDLNAGPLRVETHGMPRTYWSISLFDAETNNFYVLNDRQAKSGDAALTIVPPGAKGGIVSPTLKGVVLIRTLIDDERRLPGIDAARRRATCRAG